MPKKPSPPPSHASSADATSAPAALGPSPLKVIQVEVKRLKNDPKNARKHSKRNRDAIKASLARFGQQKPIVVTPQGMVVAGHGTLAGAKALGWTHLACTVTKLQGDDLKAYGVADNRTGELAEWDLDNLGEILRSLEADETALASAGFSLDEYAAMFPLPGEATGGGEIDVTSHTRAAAGEGEKSGPITAGEEFLVVVECEDESEQAALYSRLKAEGLTCKIL